MPYLRFESSDLPLETKRVLARQLTEAVLRAMPGELPEGTTVQFASFRAEDVAIAGQLVADGHPADYHLEIRSPPLPPLVREALVREITLALMEPLGLTTEGLRRVSIEIGEVEPGDVIIAGQYVGKRPEAESWADRFFGRQLHWPAFMRRASIQGGGERSASSRGERWRWLDAFYGRHALRATTEDVRSTLGGKFVWVRRSPRVSRWVDRLRGLGHHQQPPVPH